MGAKTETDVLTCLTCEYFQARKVFGPLIGCLCQHPERVKKVIFDDDWCELYKAKQLPKERV